jgi:hypothetical protein
MSYSHTIIYTPKNSIMKTLKTMMMGLALLFTFNFSQAATSSSPNGPTKDEAINAYLNAVVHGKLSGLADVIDEDVQFNMLRGDNVNTLNKRQMLNGLKSFENVEQDCQCTKTVVQDMDDINTVKVEMKYADFTRVDVITAQKEGKGWKITKVDTSFK